MTGVTISDSTAWNTVQEENQYSLAKILGIWVAAALPMAILGWVAYPALAPTLDDIGGHGRRRPLFCPSGQAFSQHLDGHRYPCHRIRANHSHDTPYAWLDIGIGGADEVDCAPSRVKYKRVLET